MAKIKKLIKIIKNDLSFYPFDSGSNSFNKDGNKYFKQVSYKATIPAGVTEYGLNDYEWSSVQSGGIDTSTAGIDRSVNITAEFEMFGTTWAVGNTGDGGSGYIALKSDLTNISEGGYKPTRINVCLMFSLPLFRKETRLWQLKLVIKMWSK